jgi:phage baseplate assembly protein W
MEKDFRKFYKGFSTKSYHDIGKDFDIFNVQCVEEDLLNHIFTIKGERLMMPEFGTRIPLMVFEPNDEESQNIIEEDLKFVFNYDPRVKLINLSLFPNEDNGSILAIVTLNYIEFNVTKDLHIEVRSQ